MASRMTAKVLLSSKKEQLRRNVTSGEEEVDTVSMTFSANYRDSRNKEWSKYTPTLNIAMTVLPEVANRFNVGDAFTLTFDTEV